MIEFDNFEIQSLQLKGQSQSGGINPFTGIAVDESPEHNYTAKDIIVYDEDGNPIKIRALVLELGNEDLPDAVECQLGSASDGKITPGWVIGGEKQELLEPKYSGSGFKDRSVWIKFELGEVSVHSGDEVPDDDVPNVNSLSGTGYYPLGAWDSVGVWRGSGCGTINLDFCPGGFTKVRTSTSPTDPYGY